MSKTKKPVRVHAWYDVRGKPGFDCAYPPTANYRANATLVPDGAPIPLPADVRRVLRAAINTPYGGDPELFVATQEHIKAERRRKGKV